ncbi:MAG: alpha-L-fucosidase, partial [Bacteroidales bacterium]|nr:alpha-L-fucosidase [Bacteroidales bacterium]
MSTLLNRRTFLKKSTVLSTVAGMGLNSWAYCNSPFLRDNCDQKTGTQRLPVNQLKQWQELEYGMFIHFGMSTFSGEELGSGKDPCSLYNPAGLDVDQWVRVARDAGMKYIVLTAKHVSGHCLWPSKFTDYHVGNSGNQTDVMAAFVAACQKYGILPGFYFCSWDNHHLFGSATPSNVPWENMFTTSEYCEFQFNQVEELMTQYGPFVEVWIDIPGMLSYENRVKQYQ